MKVGPMQTAVGTNVQPEHGEQHTCELLPSVLLLLWSWPTALPSLTGKLVVGQIKLLQSCQSTKLCWDRPWQS